MTAAAPRVVVVTRPTELEGLLGRHGTRAQVAFFLAGRGQSPVEVEERHRRQVAAVEHVLQAIPVAWRRSRVERADLDRFLFEPGDVVVAVGQDGLVANVAKYLAAQAVIGINPDPGAYEGVLVRHPPEAAADLLHDAAGARLRTQERCLARAELDDGQELVALNELYVGHRTHQSSRYLLRFGEEEEAQSSSGLIVATGTGATGWARSVTRNRTGAPPLPGPEEPRLVFLVREAWPSVASGTRLTDGSLGPGEALELVSRQDDGGVVFGDGLEGDRLEFGWGRRLRIGLAPGRLRLAR